MDTQSQDQPFLTLSNGVKMPQVGLGTSLSGNEVVKERVYQAVKSAIKDHNYLLIDTASIYETEEIIGNVLQEVFAEGKIKREDIFILTKLWPSERHDVEGAVRRSLKNLKLEYIDLYLLHYMVPKVEWKDPLNSIDKGVPNHIVWKELERLTEEGLLRSIGVGNCSIQSLVDLLSYAKIAPVVNQVELNPYLVQKEFVDFHKKVKVQVMAYAPFGSPSWDFRKEEYKNLNLLTDEVISEIAKKHEKSTAQIILNWLVIYRGVIVIPKTETISRLEGNFRCFDFKLSDSEYEQISSLDKGIRVFDPKHYADWGWENLPYFD